MEDGTEQLAGLQIVQYRPPRFYDLCSFRYSSGDFPMAFLKAV